MMKTLTSKYVIAGGMLAGLEMMSLWASPRSKSAAVLSAKSTIGSPRAAAAPLLVENLDEPGRNPYQDQRTIFLEPTDCVQSFCTALLTDVPEGQRLVVTNVSGTFSLSEGVKPTALYLSEGPLQARNIQVPIPFRLQSTSWGKRTYIFNQQIRAYLEPGETPVFSLRLNRPNNGTDELQIFSLVGYLVSLQ